jgi:uncharacterized protein YhaN
LAEEEEGKMVLKPEVVRVLEREQRVCEMAIDRLKERSRPLEQEYGWSTKLFLEKFNAGEVGDDKAFFLWYALAEAIQDWQQTCESLREFLANAELVSA